MFDKVNEECGVYGIYSIKPRENIAPIISVGLSALQHRGEESCRNSNKQRWNNNIQKRLRACL